MTISNTERLQIELDETYDALALAKEDAERYKKLCSLIADTARRRKDEIHRLRESKAMLERLVISKQAQIEPLRVDNRIMEDAVNHLTERAEAAESSLTELVGRLKGFDVGAVPESTEYANGWNECRKAGFGLLQRILKEYSDE